MSTLFDKAVRFHGHSCPGLAIGFKACEGAIAELGLTGLAVPAELINPVATANQADQDILSSDFTKSNSDALYQTTAATKEKRQADVGAQQHKNGRAIDEEIVCVSENDACGIDAIQFVLGATAGKGNLIIQPKGKHAYSFFSRCNAKSVRLVFTAKNDSSMDRQQYMEFLLAQPYTNLFDVKAPGFALPEPARRFASQDCEICKELTAEYALRVQNGKLVCKSCYDSYDRLGF